MLEEREILNFLKADVAPALGCTEPVCVALCAASASKYLEESVKSIEVEVNANIYKNGMSAGIPNFHQVGLKYAALLGALLKNPEKGLQLLEDINDETRKRADELAERDSVNVSIDYSEKSLYVKCTVRTESDTCICITRDSHTNITFIQKNEEILLEKESSFAQSENLFVEELKKMTIAQIRAAVDAIPEENLLFMLDGVEMNEQLAAFSETRKAGVGIADTLRKNINSALLSNDLMNRIQLMVASAAESRLDGCPYPTMSSSGAGTKGLVVILPISETAKELGCSREKEVKALAFGHLVNRYINAYMGKLSAMCTCAMASSTAASAAITWLLGGNDRQIGYAIRNMTGTITGMICDGGKVGCAMKVAMSSTAALLSAITAVNDSALRVSDGICAETPEQCILNMARIGNPGMLATDKEILNVMTDGNDG